MYHGWYIITMELMIFYRKTSIGVLLPLFPNDSKSVAMIRHSKDLRSAVNIVNHGQTPVVPCDQPL